MTDYFYVFKYFVNKHPIHLVREEIVDEIKAVEYANQHLNFADNVEIYKSVRVQCLS